MKKQTETALTDRQITVLRTLHLIGGTAFRDDGGPDSQVYRNLADRGLIAIDFIPLGETKLTPQGQVLCDARWGNTAQQESKALAVIEARKRVRGRP